MNRPAYVLAFVAMVLAGGGAALATWSVAGQVLSGTADDLFETVSREALENGSPRTTLEAATWRSGMLDEEAAIAAFARAEGYSAIAERPKLVRLQNSEAWALVVDGNELRTQARAGGGPPSFRIYFYDAHTGEFLRVVEGSPRDGDDTPR